MPAATAVFLICDESITPIAENKNIIVDIGIIGYDDVSGEVDDDDDKDC